MVTPGLLPTLFISIATGLISAYIAEKKGRRPYIWFFVGFIFGLLGTLALFFAPKPKERIIVAQKSAINPYLMGPIDKFWYYADSENTLVGPLSHDAITQEWRTKKINKDTFIWHEELTEWKKVDELVRK
jgi:hypothetical protein